MPAPQLNEREPCLLVDGSYPVLTAGGRDEEAFAHCENLVREADKDRFLATLFAPADRRNALYVLYAFNCEIVRVRERINQPLAGEVRLQWWREVLEGTTESGGHPVAGALAVVRSRHELSTASLLDLINARSFDLYDEPMRTRAELEDYARRTSSVLFALAQQLLNCDARASPASSEAGGQAYGITAALRGLQVHATRGQLYLPQDLLSRHGVDREDVISRKPSRGLSAAVGELCSDVRQQLTSMRAALAQLPPHLTPAMLPLAVVPLYLERMERRNYDPFTTPADVSQWRLQWALWRAARDPRRL
jgi:15-cis-phytoene synthase